MINELSNGKKYSNLIKEIRMKIAGNRLCKSTKRSVTDDIWSILILMQCERKIFTFNIVDWVQIFKLRFIDYNSFDVSQ